MAVKELIALITKALESRAAALILAVIVLYGGYDLAKYAVDSMSGKLDIVSKELAGIRQELAIQSIKLTEMIEKVKDHEERLRDLEKKDK
jgi:hypothetical protein